MPIVGGILQQAARQFCDELNRVLAKTVTQTRLVSVVPKVRNPRLAEIAFRQAAKVTRAALKTRFGPMFLAISQNCGLILTRGKQHQLVTVEYRYTLTPEGTEEALLRWEYVRRPTGPWCKHHLQGNVPLVFGKKTVSLNDLHLPTGYVTIEEVLRFCIVDLEVRPLAEDWDETLSDSYERFKTEFAP